MAQKTIRPAGTPGSLTLAVGRILYIALCPLTADPKKEDAWTGEDFSTLKREVDREANAGTVTRDVKWYTVFHSPKCDGGVLIVSRRLRNGGPLPSPHLGEQERVLSAVGIAFERVQSDACGEYLKPLTVETEGKANG